MLNISVWNVRIMNEKNLMDSIIESWDVKFVILCVVFITQRLHYHHFLTSFLFPVVLCMLFIPPSSVHYFNNFVTSHFVGHGTTPSILPCVSSFCSIVFCLLSVFFILGLPHVFFYSMFCCWPCSSHFGSPSTTKPYFASNLRYIFFLCLFCFVLVIFVCFVFVFSFVMLLGSIVCVYFCSFLRDGRCSSCWSCWNP